MKSRAARSRVGVSALGLTVAFASVVARATQTAARVPVLLTYLAPPECPSRKAFVEQLEARRVGVSLTDDPLSTRRVSVTVVAEAGQFVGRLQFDDDAGTAAMRSVQAGHCEEAVSAMALVTALALEAQLSPRAKQASSEASSAVVHAARPPKALEAPTARVQNAPPNAPTAPRTPWTNEASMGLGVLPDLVGPGVTMAVGVDWGFGPTSVIPTFRLGATWADNRRTSDIFGGREAVQYRLLAAKGELCSGRRLAASVLSGSLCLGTEFGQYAAEGIPDLGNGSRGHDYAMFWSAVVTDAHLRVEAAPVFFDFAPSLRAPLIRRTFVLRGASEDTYRIPTIAFGAFWSVGVTFR